MVEAGRNRWCQIPVDEEPDLIVLRQNLADDLQAFSAESSAVAVFQTLHDFDSRHLQTVKTKADVQCPLAVQQRHLLMDRTHRHLLQELYRTGSHQERLWKSSPTSATGNVHLASTTNLASGSRLVGRTLPTVWARPLRKQAVQLFPIDSIQSGRQFRVLQDVLPQVGVSYRTNSVNDMEQNEGSSFIREGRAQKP